MIIILLKSADYSKKNHFKKILPKFFSGFFDSAMSDCCGRAFSTPAGTDGLVAILSEEEAVHGVPLHWC
jgi:hypothetical protein